MTASDRARIAARIIKSIPKIAVNMTRSLYQIACEYCEIEPEDQEKAKEKN